MTLSPSASVLRHEPARQPGFTLVELMVVIAIGALLAMVGVPSMQGLLRTMRQNSALSLVMSDINLARAEAIKRNGRALVCARSTDGTNCNASTAWQSGWVVCIEGAVANECALGTETLPNPIVVRPALDSTLALTASATTPVRFSANAARAAGSTSVTLQGSWSGAVTQYVCVATNGGISKRTSTCP